VRAFGPHPKCCGGHWVIPGARRCGARGPACKAGTRAALRPGTLRFPARSWLTTDSSGPSAKARPGKPNKGRYGAPKGARASVSMRTIRTCAFRRAIPLRWGEQPIPGAGKRRGKESACLSLDCHAPCRRASSNHRHWLLDRRVKPGDDNSGAGAYTKAFIRVVQRIGLSLARHQMDSRKRRGLR